MPLHEGKSLISRKEYKSRYVSMIRVISFVAFLYLPVLYVGLNNFTSDTDAVWFQRSGSMLVFICIVVQFLFLNLHRLAHDTPIDFGMGNIRTEIEDFKLRRKGKSLWRSEPSFTILHELYIVVFGAVGTLIWGYGDLIYKWLQ